MKRSATSGGLLLVGLLVSMLHIRVPTAHAGGPGADGALVNGDTNCDGDRNMTDAILLLNWMFVGGSRPCALADSPHLVERVEELEAGLAERDAENARLQAELEEARAALETCEGALDEAEAAFATCDTSRAEVETALTAAEERIAELEGDNQRPGCTDSDAPNFDPCAEVDDGSCEYPGCTDPDAVNFDPDANVDDGSCARDLEGFTFVTVNDGGRAEYLHDATSIVFIRLPGGDFEMGSPEEEEGRAPDEGPVHTVTLSPFLIAKYEVTQAEYAAVMEGHPTLSATPSVFTGDDQRPVDHVSWDDVSSEDGFLARTGYSLPSEAQWEYACRAGQVGPYSGSGEIGEMAWHNSNSGNRTRPVGEKAPNQFGLHDMHGNIYEWCEDVHDVEFYGTAEAVGPDPVSVGDSGDRILRGGGWHNDAGLCRSAYRLGILPSFRNNCVGFRPVLPMP